MTTIIDLSSGKIEEAESQEPIPFMQRPKVDAEPSMFDRTLSAMKSGASALSNNPDVAANINAAESVVTPFSQILGGSAAMVAEPLAYGKQFLLDLISNGPTALVNEASSGRKWWGPGEDPMRTYPLKDSYANRAFEKGQEAAADAQKLFGYQPRSALAQETVVKPMEEIMSIPGKALSIKGDWYKPLGIDSLEVTNPKVAHYLDMAAMLLFAKAGESVAKGTIRKYTASAEQIKAIKETGNIPNNFELLQEQIAELALKSKKADDLAAAQKAMVEHETKMAALRPKTLAEERQAQINEAIPAESPLAQTPKERQKIIDNTLADAEKFSDQPSRVVQPVDQLKQSQEVGQILQGQKPPIDPKERQAREYNQGWFSRLLPDPNARWRRVFESADQAKEIELQQKAKYPAQVPKPTVEMPVEEPPVVKNLTQETKPEESRPERRSREYVPSSSEATLTDFPLGKETSAVINRYRMDDQLYTTKGGNTEFVSHDKAAAVAKKNGGTVLPKENGKFVVALEPKDRVIFERDAIRTESGMLAEAEAKSGLSPIEQASPPEGKAATKVERPVSDPDLAIQEMKGLLPEFEKYSSGDPTITAEMLKDKVRKISDQFVSDTGKTNSIYTRAEELSNELIVSINRIDMARKGVKIQEFADLKPETMADLEALYDAIIKDPKAVRDQLSSKIDTPEQAIAIADGFKVESKIPKSEAAIRAEAEKMSAEIMRRHKKNIGKKEAELTPEQWLAEQEKNDPVLRETVDYENRRALDMEKSAEDIDAGDLWSAFNSILGNESGQWTIRSGKEAKPPNPVERLTAEQVASFDTIWKVAKRQGLEPKEFMKRAGISDDIIALAEKVYNDHIEPMRKQGLDPVLQGPFKDKNPSDVIKQAPTRNYKGQVISKAPVMRSPADALVNTPDLKQGLTRGITNPIYVFDKLPPALKEYYYQAREKLHNVTTRSDTLFKEVDEAASGLSKKSLKRVMAYKIGAQERGPAILQSMGVKEVKALSPKELEFSKFLDGKLSELFKQTNEVRTAIGKNPLKELPNYYTFMRSFSFMERMAGTKNEKVNLVLDNVENINQMHNAFEGAAFPYTTRAKTGVMTLDMDPVAVFKKYAKSAIRHQEVSPIMAEIGELAKGFQLDKVNPKSGKTEWFNPRRERPGITNFLVDWSNHIGGQTIDPLPPTARWILNGLNKNIAFSTLSYNATSALMQPASLANTVAQIGSWHTMKGIIMTLDPRAWDKAISQSKVLKSRVAELDISGEGVASKVEKVAEFGLKPLKWLDAEAAVSTWLGAKEYAASRKMGAKESIRFADDVVTKTQSSTMPNDMAPISRTVGGRTISQFQSFMINNWNFLTKEVMGLGGDKPLVTKSFKDADAGTIRKTTRMVVAALAMNEAYKALGMRAPYPDPAGAIIEGMDKQDSAYEIAMGVAGEFAEVVPFLGNIKYSKTPFGPAVDIVNNLVTGGKYGKTVKKEVGELIEDQKVPENTLEQGARLAGVPGTNQMMKYLRARKRGEEGFDAVVGRYEK